MGLILFPIFLNFVLIYLIMERKEFVEACLRFLKESRNYSSLDDEILRKSITFVLSSEMPLMKKLDKVKSTRSKFFKEVLSKAKARLRKQALVYFPSEAKSPSLKERKEIPEPVLNEISRINPRRFVDLGCGLNPLFFPYSRFSVERYLAIDINKQIVKKANDFFQSKGIQGEAVAADIKAFNFDEVFDVAFLFKLLDLVDDSGHKKAEMIFTALKAKMIIISFPTKTLSGKSMTFSRRTWVEKMLSRLKHQFKIIETENEVFYVVSFLGRAN